MTTDKDSYEADVLVVALGAEYDFAATPGFEEGGFEYYSLAGAERLRDVLPDFDSGTVLIAVLGHPFKCPPAPFEGAFLLHDLLRPAGNQGRGADSHDLPDGGARSGDEGGLADVP